MQNVDIETSTSGGVSFGSGATGYGITFTDGTAMCLTISTPVSGTSDLCSKL